MVEPERQSPCHCVLETLTLGYDRLVQHGVPGVMTWPVLAGQLHGRGRDGVRPSPDLRCTWPYVSQRGLQVGNKKVRTKSIVDGQYKSKAYMASDTVQ